MLWWPLAEPSGLQLRGLTSPKVPLLNAIALCDVPTILRCFCAMTFAMSEREVAVVVCAFAHDLAGDDVLDVPGFLRRMYLPATEVADALVLGEEFGPLRWGEGAAALGVVGHRTGTQCSVPSVQENKPRGWSYTCDGTITLPTMMNVVDVYPSTRSTILQSCV